MQYEIITALDKTEIIQTITAYLTNGWELAGGISITSYLGPNGKPVRIYAQAVVKKGN
jgi:hypothetical protein